MEPIIDVAIDEQDLTEVAEFSPEQLEDTGIDWKAKAQELSGIARRRTTALKKLKENITKKPEPAPAPAPDPTPKKGELDYGQKAFLNSLGHKLPDQQKLVQETMTNSGKSLEEVLAMPFITAEMSRIAEEVAAKDAVAPGDNRQGEPVRDTVEYWLKKGELPPADQVELRRKVVDAKAAKDAHKGMFTDNPIVK